MAMTHLTHWPAPHAIRTQACNLDGHDPYDPLAARLAVGCGLAGWLAGWRGGRAVGWGAGAAWLIAPGEGRRLARSKTEGSHKFFSKTRQPTLHNLYQCTNFFFYI